MGLLFFGTEGTITVVHSSIHTLQDLPFYVAPSRHLAVRGICGSYNGEISYRDRIHPEQVKADPIALARVKLGHMSMVISESPPRGSGLFHIYRYRHCTSYVPAFSCVRPRRV